MLYVRRFAVVSAVTLLLIAGSAIPAAAQNALFWVESGFDGTNDTGTIQNAALDGSLQTTLIGGLNFPAGLAVDALNGKVYWVDVAEGTIFRANLDGSTIETVIDNLPLLQGSALTLSIAIDPIANKIYWAEGVNGVIQRADADGLNQNIEDIVTSVFAPTGLALDVDGGFIFWTDFLTGEVLRADANGLNLGIQTIMTGLTEPFGLAHDPFATQIYVSDLDSDTIERADDFGLDLNREVVVTGQNDPTYLSLDLLNGQLFWSDEGSATIRSANLDGSNITTVAVGMSNPAGIVVASSPVCAFLSDLETQLNAFRTSFNVSESDLDGDGIPEDALILLVQDVLCFDPAGILGVDTLAAFDANLMAFDNEASAGLLLQIREFIAVLMFVSADMQTDLNTILTAGSAPLTQAYAIVNTGAGPDYAGPSDLDGDGVTNVQELDNVLAAGAGFAAWVDVVQDPARDGTNVGPGPPTGGRNDGSVCFIATAAYGTPLAHEIDGLRAFRDRSLLPTAIGTAFSDMYYRLSPAIANRVAEQPLIATVVRAGLRGLREWTLLGLLGIGFAGAITIRRKLATGQPS